MSSVKVLYDYGCGDEEKEAVANLIAEAAFTRPDQKTELEREYCQYIGSKYAIALDSGTAGVHCCLAAAGVGPGDEIVTAANTHWSPYMMIFNVGAKPVLVDDDEDTHTIDPSKIEKKITLKSKAIMPIHTAGHPYDIDKVHEIAEKHGLVIIEDAAQSLGARYKGKPVGTRGDVAVFSFAVHKHVMAGGWGGIVLTNNEELAEKVKRYAYLGGGTYGFARGNKSSLKPSPTKSDMELSGFSYGLSEIHAAIARVQFKKFREGPLNVEKRRNVAMRYHELLKEFPFIKPPIEKDWAYHSYLRYIIRAPKRDELYSFLEERDIYVAKHYSPPAYTRKFFVDVMGPPKEPYPVADRASREVLSLPIWASVTNEQVDYVVDSIRQFYRNNPINS